MQSTRNELLFLSNLKLEQINFITRFESMIVNAASMPNAGIPEIRKDWYGSIIGLVQEDSLNN